MGARRRRQARQRLSSHSLLAYSFVLPFRNVCARACGCACVRVCVRAWCGWVGGRAGRLGIAVPPVARGSSGRSLASEGSLLTDFGDPDADAGDSDGSEGSPRSEVTPRYAGVRTPTAHMGFGLGGTAARSLPPPPCECP